MWGGERELSFHLLALLLENRVRRRERRLQQAAAAAAAAALPAVGVGHAKMREALMFA